MVVSVELGHGFSASTSEAPKVQDRSPGPNTISLSPRHKASSMSDAI